MSGSSDGPDEDYLDEMLQESFPASDPPSSWPGRDTGDDGTPGSDGVRNPLPEADDSLTAQAWDETDPMEGPAPTG